MKQTLWQKTKKRFGGLSTKARIGLGVLIAAILLLLVSTCAQAQLRPSDNGLWSSPQTFQQGFVAQYAPGIVPGIVFFWFTYDGEGKQAWLISDNIPIESGSEAVGSVYKPMGSFASMDAARGDSVGMIAVSRLGSSLMIRFALAPVDGFAENCASETTAPVLPSPLPPAFTSDEYPCQGILVVNRLTAPIPELE